VAAAAEQRVHHSDHGSQYASIEAGVRPSRGAVGDAYDNAMVERLSIGVASRSRPKRASPSSNSSRAFAIRVGVTHRSSSPITFERDYAATGIEPRAHQHAVVLALVKERPASVITSCIASVPAVLDSRSTRRPWQRASRDEKMLSSEPKDRPKEEDKVQSNQVP
jgi:hypothetical protein